MHKKTILIGEDEKNIQKMYQIAFEQAGYKIITADNGQEVIDKAKEEDPDILLLDINMPVKDGFEVLRDISEDPSLYQVFSQVPILVLSNYSNPQDIEYCMKKGAQDFLVKSDWTPKAIVQKIANYLEEIDNL